MVGKINCKKNHRSDGRNVATKHECANEILAQCRCTPRSYGNFTEGALFKRVLFKGQQRLTR